MKRLYEVDYFDYYNDSYTVLLEGENMEEVILKSKDLLNDDCFIYKIEMVYTDKKVI